MSKPLEALGYRVVDNMKVIGHYEKGSVAKNDETLTRARQSGVKLAKTLKLRKEVEAKIKSTEINLFIGS
ncbi:MAG: hypothetical protein U9N81_10245 [Bacillota bacterium]|nr:hypothetical protein [Bacillota bacterium]